MRGVAETPPPVGYHQIGRPLGDAAEKHGVVAGEPQVGAELPPELASPQPPVSGDLPTNVNRPPSARVPVNVPVTKPRMLSEPSGSTPAHPLEKDLYP